MVRLHRVELIASHKITNAFGDGVKNFRRIEPYGEAEEPRGGVERLRVNSIK